MENFELRRAKKMTPNLVSQPWHYHIMRTGHSSFAASAAESYKSTVIFSP